MKKLSIICALASFATACQSAPRYEPGPVREWTRAQAAAIPLKAPLLATFRKQSRWHEVNAWIEFAVDEPRQPELTLSLVQDSLSRAKPEIIVVEGAAFKDGIDPYLWEKAYLSRRPEELLNEGWAGPRAAYAASSAGVPFIGSDPSIEELQKSEALAQAGYSATDLLYFEILRGVPYARDRGEARTFGAYLSYFKKRNHLEWTAEETNTLTHGFLQWHESRARKRFVYLEGGLPEPSCEPQASRLSRMNCELGLFRDRFALEVLERLLETHPRVLMVRGERSFVQMLPALTSEWGEPSYRKP